MGNDKDAVAASDDLRAGAPKGAGAEVQGGTNLDAGPALLARQTRLFDQLGKPFVVGEKIDIATEQPRLDADLQRSRTKEGDSELTIRRQGGDQFFQRLRRRGFPIEF